MGFRVPLLIVLFRVQCPKGISGVGLRIPRGFAVEVSGPPAWFYCLELGSGGWGFRILHEMCVSIKKISGNVVYYTARSS